MAHQFQITITKSHWLKAVLGLGITKEGLAPFCDEVARAHHEQIKQETSCTNPNCQTGHIPGKTFCGHMYDIIKRYHASNTPQLKNTEPHQWKTGPWSIAKCYIFTTGYEQKTSAADTDITGLLHVIINNTYFRNHVSCNMTGPNIFKKVRDYRNQIFHSSNQELEEQETNKYIDDMIAVLQDGMELNNRPDAQEAVTKLQDLKGEDYVITTENYEKVLGEISEDLSFIKDAMKGRDKLEQIVESHASIIRELTQVIKDLHGDSSKNKMDFNKSKADLQKKLIERYKDDDYIYMPVMPCQPQDECSFKDVYVTPRITLKSKEGKGTETEVKTMSDIFIKESKLVKSIYILGEAGSGKTSFCKSLVQCWCIAHTETQHLDPKKAEDDTDYHADLVKVMKKFHFLFFLRLRDYINKNCITNMLKEKYEHDVLNELLKQESETCLIVLDGLDEWSHTEKCRPVRQEFSKYTVLTTSRPWKIGTLGIKDNEMRQRIYIKGVGDTSRMNMITNILKILQEKFPNNKRGKDEDGPRECYKRLAEEPFCSLTHSAIMLQQLICLWFDGKLHATSKCKLYTSMLDMFFDWYKGKLNKSLSFSNIIQGVSRLAYETLIKTNKETSLTFDNSMFQQLDISDDIKDCCLKLGILSEEKGPSLCASSSRKSHISFIHKSVQEYLAAKHIVWEIQYEQEETTKRETRPSSADKENDDVSENLSQMLNVKTLDELLEQENVLIMLCGMDYMVAKSVSKLVYNIVAKDDRVVRYRKTINDDISNVFLIAHIQTFILNCAEENKLHKFSLDLGDLVLQCFPNNSRIIDEIERNITLDSVMSFYTETTEKQEYECMTKCKNLERIQLEGKFDEKGYKRIWGSIEVNASTLKCLSLKRSPDMTFGVHTSPFRHIANMTHLVALRVEGFTVKNEDFTSLCTFLSGTGNLQQIAIRIDCECEQQHEVDLSKHKQLQYLEYSAPVVLTKVVDTNLDVIKCFSLNIGNYKNVLDSLKYSLEIKNICLYFSSDTPDLPIQQNYNTFTSELIGVISLSQKLCYLTVSGVTLTDNIIKHSSQMKSLENIEISEVTMSLKTWQRFVDSVAELPQLVQVRAWGMCITQVGKECDPEILWRTGGGEEAAALRYVEERLIVDFLDKYLIIFFNKKVTFC